MKIDLSNSKIGVIGFNARPIACSLKKMGALVYVSDYWGDDDLPLCSTHWTSVLHPTKGHRQRRRLEKPTRELLIDNFLESFDGYDFDIVIIGSGFDDYPESLQPIARKWVLAGNSISQIRNARNHRKIRDILEEYEIGMPRSWTVNSIDEIQKMTEYVDFPFVIRPATSGGGRGIRFIRNQSDYESIFDHLMTKYEKILVQEYISGLDFSCSILSTNSEARTISIQGQFIGTPSAGRNCDFVYCGNYIPFELDLPIRKRINEFCEVVCNQLNLIGSNGIDFIIDKNNQIWFLEINPRIQGSMELLELSSGISLVLQHVNASNGNLFTKPLKYSPAVRLVVFARSSGFVPDLNAFKCKKNSTHELRIVDRTPEGVFVKHRDPVCTILSTNQDIHMAYSSAIRVASQINTTIYKSWYVLQR